MKAMQSRTKKGIGSMNKECLRYVYILNVSSIGRSKFYGMKDIYYIGQTSNICRRISQHVSKESSNFLKKHFPNSRKKLIYVEYIIGTEYKAIERELQLKKLSRNKKEELISSKENQLIKYIPFKAVILKKLNNDKEQTCLKMNYKFKDKEDKHED